MPPSFDENKTNFLSSVSSDSRITLSFLGFNNHGLEHPGRKQKTPGLAVADYRRLRPRQSGCHISFSK